jgi:hypothetical protein
VQLVLLKVPAPVLLKLTLPVGVVCVPMSMSLTVAAHVVDWPVAITPGVQLTEVAVRRWVVAAKAGWEGAILASTGRAPKGSRPDRATTATRTSRLARPAKTPRSSKTDCAEEKAGRPRAKAMPDASSLKPRTLLASRAYRDSRFQLKLWRPYCLQDYQVKLIGDLPK